jgi:hypothetical protein
VALALIVTFRRKDRLETVSQKLEKLVNCMESQLLAGIDFFRPALEMMLRWFSFRSQSDYESASHDLASLRGRGKEGVTSRSRFGLFFVTLVVVMNLSA